MPVLVWKYNMDNIQAALLIGQLERIDALWEKRNRLWEMYEQEFQGLRGTRILKTLPGVMHARHLFTLLVDSDRRDQLLWQMQEKGVGVAVNYRPIHLLKYYRETFGYHEGSFPVAEEIGARTISLPLYPSLSEADARYVIQTVKEILH
jgi:dTDP-4-amino-4,6-dideoxygalactose transaminase